MGKMRAIVAKKMIPALFLTAIALILFQNCDVTNLQSSASMKPETSASTDGNGQPYDGKPFIIEARCPDGTQVQSRLIVKQESKVEIYRENCNTIAPRVVDSAALVLDPKNPDKLTYNSQVYEAEKPAIPLPGMVSWYYQLTGQLQPQPASIYIVDMFDNDAATIASLKADGHTVICSMSAGRVENWRPDASSFAKADIGNRADGQGEYWVDTRSSNVRSIMLSRLDLARDKGCHGIDFDSVDGYLNNTGFALNATTQIDYNRFLAFAAHDRKLILSLNNVPELANDLSQIFDFAIAEECFRYNECSSYLPFITRAKPVLAVEYSNYSTQQCQQAKDSLISLSYFDSNLDGSRYEPCK